MKRKRGFKYAPKPSELQPTEREKRLLEQLWNWQEQSKRSAIQLGVPYATVRAKEWDRMPQKTKKALVEIVNLAAKAQLAKGTQ